MGSIRTSPKSLIFNDTPRLTESLNVESKATLIALLVAGAVVCSAPHQAFATETENLGLAVLPTPGPVTIDGRYDDWDLSGGIFVCGDVETYPRHAQPVVSRDV